MTPTDQAQRVPGATGGDARTGASGQFEGGDLIGVAEKLDYLQDLGVTCYGYRHHIRAVIQQVRLSIQTPTRTYTQVTMDIGHHPPISTIPTPSIHRPFLKWNHASAPVLICTTSSTARTRVT